MTASIFASSSNQTVSPTAPSTCDASARPASSTLPLATRPVTPMPISAGVFGITRTMRLWPFSQRDMSPMRMPATMLTISCDARRCAASVSATLFRICGFTASTTAS
ncbi:hypothetical protein OKW34_006230 [Paraburkholderia youngii]